MKRMITIFYAGKLILFGMMTTLILVSSCKKGEPDPNFLGGEWDIPLTKVGSSTSLYPKIGDYELPTFEAVISKNDQGYVTYKISGDLDLSGRPDSAFIEFLKEELIGSAYLTVDSNGLLNVEFTLRITSDGYQIVSEKTGKPSTIVRYDDPLGTTYSFNNVYTENKIIGRVTEKTGQDDWPFGFLYIKTSKVEFQYPSDFPLVDKIILRANHRFGIVYFEIKFKNNQSATMDAIPWHML
jgi:hypothetical protein